MSQRSQRRFVVRPIDNLGSVEGLKRDRTWGVFDRKLGHYVAERETRVLARKEAKQLSEENASVITSKPVAVSKPLVEATEDGGVIISGITWEER